MHHRAGLLLASQINIVLLLSSSVCKNISDISKMLPGDK